MQVHKSHGHDTEDYIQLKDAIEGFIHKEKLVTIWSEIKKEQGTVNWYLGQPFRREWLKPPISPRKKKIFEDKEEKELSLAFAISRWDERSIWTNPRCLHLLGKFFNHTCCGRHVKPKWNGLLATNVVFVGFPNSKQAACNTMKRKVKDMCSRNEKWEATWWWITKLLEANWECRWWKGCRNTITRGG